jgi:dTDP-4-amino-4,6-dideoxygalactose transaminase
MSKDAWKRFSDEGYKHYQVVCAGFKNNMMDIQAALGIHQLPRVEKYWERRKQIWEKYNYAFQDLPVFTPAPAESGTRHAYHLYTLILDIERMNMSRDQFLDKMHRKNVGTGVHYIAPHLHPYYQKVYGYRSGDFPNAEWISERTVSIPLSPKLTDDVVEEVIEAVKDILKG